MNGLRFPIRSQKDLEKAVKTLGFVPFFANSIPGFSIEEQIPRDLWFTDAPGPWEWKGPVIRATGCAYGKFFEHKACYVSMDWFPDLANYRRDGYDFDARFEDGLASYKDRALFELLDVHGPILSRKLKELGNYRKGGTKGFDSGILRLQAQCYVTIADFVYEKDKHGKTYGWGVAEYATPEQLFGEAFTSKVYQRDPQESYERVKRHLLDILPGVEEKAVERFLK